METEPAGAAEGDGRPLDDEDYRRIRRAAETYRESLFVRLCGEVGLRPAEVSRLTPGDFAVETARDGDHYLLVLSGDGDAAGRTAYVPATVHADVERYVNAEGVGDDDRIFDVSPRRVQMVVSAVTDRAAERFDEETYRRASSRTLRRYYGRRLLRTEGVDPRVAMAVGDWNRLESVLRDDGPVGTRSILRAFAGTSFAEPTAGIDADDVEAAVDQATPGVVITGSDDRVEYVNDGFASLTGFARDDVAGRDAAVVYADEKPAAGDGDGETAWVRLRRVDGEPVDVFQTRTPVVTDAGTGAGSVRVFVELPDEEATGRASEASGGARLADVVAAFRSVGAVLPTASNRDAIERRVCERIVATNAYEFAWIGGQSGGRQVAPTAWSGVDETAVEALAESANDREDSPMERAIATGEVQHWTADQQDVQGRPPLPAGADAMACVPLSYGDTTHGVLCLGTGEPESFRPEERDLLTGLGWQVGQAMTDVERKKLLMADSVLELEFQIRDPSAFFVGVSDRFGASFELEGLVPGEAQSLLYFVTVSGTSPDEVLTFGSEAENVENARLIRDYGERYLLEFIVSGEEPATMLTEVGGHVSEFVAEDGVQRIGAEFTPETDVRTVVNGLQSSFGGAKLLSKQERERSVQTTDGFRQSLEGDLTSKQQSVLRAAYLAGYFEWPRGSTAEELADSIGVSSPTLHNHLRKAQQKLLTSFFDDE